MEATIHLSTKPASGPRRARTAARGTMVRASYDASRKLHLFAQISNRTMSDLLDDIAAQLPEIGVLPDQK